MVRLNLGQDRMGKAAGSYTALSFMNPTELEAEVHPLRSRANSMRLHWISLDANLSFEGTVSWWSSLLVNSALPTLNSGLRLHGCFKFSDCNRCPSYGVLGVMAKLMLQLLRWRRTM